eukprot:282298-Amphidinium_carterae.1
MSAWRFRKFWFSRHHLTWVDGSKSRFNFKPDSLPEAMRSLRADCNHNGLPPYGTKCQVCTRMDLRLQPSKPVQPKL